MSAARPARLVLVGFMGAGKTSVGELLAARLHWEFVDLDRLVELRTGRSVAALFSEQGEAAFREQERLAALSLASRERCVVAAGGGAWVQPDTRALLGGGALSVFLSADLDTLLGRLPRDAARPLAVDRARIPVLLAERDPSYRLADLSVDTTGMSLHEVADEIVRQLPGRLDLRGEAR